MGGFGSGLRYKQSKRTVESCQRIDIRERYRDDLLIPGTQFPILWEFGEINLVLVQVFSTSVTLNYIIGTESFREPVRLTHTSCPYGGSRPWFVCPKCNRRAAILYASGNHFRCRKCCDLVYTSQREKGWHRAERQLNKVIYRLGGDPDDENYPEKPKCMHWSTYNRLLSRVEAYDEVSSYYFAKFLNRCLSR